MCITFLITALLSLLTNIVIWFTQGYVIESWHEKLGTTRQTVAVQDGELAKIKIQY